MSSLSTSWILNVSLADFGGETSREGRRFIARLHREKCWKRINELIPSELTVNKNSGSAICAVVSGPRDVGEQFAQVLESENLGSMNWIDPNVRYAICAPQVAGAE